MGSLGYHAPAEYAHPLITERSIDEPRPLRVIYIGAGFSGINAAVVFPKIPSLELTIYEKNPDVGGAWFENRYPGCGCDVPAHRYQYSFESSVEWDAFYANRDQILQYLQRVADKYDIRKYIKFNHKVVEARWNESTRKWHVWVEQIETGQVTEEVGDVFMTGFGALNRFKWPDIQGLHDYKGKLVHTAKWDETWDYTNKSVAVIGIGSSAIQLIPAVQPKVKHMDHYLRGSTWISQTSGAAIVAKRNDGRDGNFSYTEEEKSNWKSDPASYVAYRKSLEARVHKNYPQTHRGSQLHKDLSTTIEKDMRQRLATKPDVMEHMIPNFSVGCRRLSPGPGLLEAMVSDNVNVVTTPISHVDETGIVTKDGIHRAVDAIFCATGFDMNYSDMFPIYGRNGADLREHYRVRPSTYLGLCTDQFPNFFQSFGFQTAVDPGNQILMFESVHNYVFQILQRLSTDNIRTIEPKKSAVLNFTDYCDAFFKRTVFSDPCRTWYKTSPEGTSPEDQKYGRVSWLWPGSSLHAYHALEKVRYEDFDMTYHDENPMAWFGDGWCTSQRNGDEEGMTWFINDTRMLHEDLTRVDR